MVGLIPLQSRTFGATPIHPYGGNPRPAGRLLGARWCAISRWRCRAMRNATAPNCGTSAMPLGVTNCSVSAPTARQNPCRASNSFYGEPPGNCGLIAGRGSFDEPGIAYELLKRLHGQRARPGRVSGPGSAQVRTGALMASAPTRLGAQAALRMRRFARHTRSGHLVRSRSRWRVRRLGLGLGLGRRRVRSLLVVTWL